MIKIYFDILILMEYIENLANNYPELNKPIELDIIIEGGLFNGMYSCGALLLIKGDNCDIS